MRTFSLLAVVAALGCSSSEAISPASAPDPDAGAQVAQSGADAGEATPDGAAALGLSIQLSRPVASIRRGAKITIPVAIARTGFDAPVDLSVSGLPGAIATQGATAAAGQTQASLSFDASASAPLGAAQATITARASAGGRTLIATAPLSIVVNEHAGLDPTFGTGGKVSFGHNDAYRAPSSLAVQPDAKIVVALGYSPDYPRVSPVGGAYRFTDAGALDPTFGQGGLVTLPALASAPYVVLQPDGKIVLCGSAVSDSRLTLARLTTAGALDASFGAGGLAQVPAGGPRYCQGLAIDASGRLLATATTYVGTTQSTAWIARFLPSGALDATFGSNGLASTDLGGAPRANLRTIRVTAQGIFAIGDRIMSNANPIDRGVVVKLDAQGRLDPTFGAAGVYEHTYQVFELLPLATGHVIFANQTQYYRLTPSGALDASFGQSGALQTSPNDWSFPFSVSTLDASGQLYRFRDQGQSNWLPELWSYTPNGMLDTSFGDNGRIRQISPGQVTYLEDITIGPDGRLVVLATGGNTNLWLARFVL